MYKRQLQAQSQAWLLGGNPPEFPLSADADVYGLDNGDVLVVDGFDLVRVDQMGNVVWGRHYEENGSVVIINHVCERSDGQLVMAIANVTVDGVSLGWMRTNAQGVPQAASFFTGQPFPLTSASISLHTDDSFTMLCIMVDQDGNSFDRVLRFNASGTLAYAKQEIDGFSLSGVHDQLQWNDATYKRTSLGILKLNAQDEPVWISDYLGAGVEVESLRATQQGVYFTFEQFDASVNRPGIGLLSHDGELLWTKLIIGMDPLLQDEPSFLNLDLAVGNDRMALYAEMSGEDALFLFTMDLGLDPIHAGRLSAEFTPEVIALTTEGGVALACSQDLGRTALHITDANMALGECAQSVEFTVQDVVLSTTPWFLPVYTPYTPTITSATIVGTPLAVSSVVGCADVGVAENHSATPGIRVEVVGGILQVDADVEPGSYYTLYDVAGSIQASGSIQRSPFTVSIPDLSEGCYLIGINGFGAQRFVVAK